MTAARPLEGRCAIVTGASRGLGFEIARQYLLAGASVAICARDEALLAQAASALKAFSGPGQSLVSLTADVSKPADAVRLIEAAVGQFGRIDVLVNNAGVIGPAGALEHVDVDAWMRSLEINVMSSVLMSQKVLPHLRRSGRGKIIQLSGGGATNALPNLSAYAASKAAVVRFIETLAEELRPDRIDVNAVAPGMLDTRMMDQMLAAGADVIGREFHERLAEEKRRGGTPLGKGAELAVFLGSSASDGITGKLISAVWDPWRTFPDRLAALNGTDIYTLRRIVPRDRGAAWADEP